MKHTPQPFCLEEDCCATLLSEVLARYVDCDCDSLPSSCHQPDECDNRNDAAACAFLHGLATERAQELWLDVMRNDIFPLHSIEWPAEAEALCWSSRPRSLAERIQNAEAALGRAAFSAIERAQADEEAVDAWFA